MSRRRNPLKPKGQRTADQRWVKVRYFCTDGKRHRPAWLDDYMAPADEHGQPVLLEDGRCWRTSRAPRNVGLVLHSDGTFESTDGTIEHEDGSRSFPPCPRCGKRTTVTDPAQLRALLAFARLGAPLRVDVTTGTLLDS